MAVKSLIDDVQECVSSESSEYNFSTPENKYLFIRIAIMVPIIKAFISKRNGQISDLEYKIIFSECWDIILSQSGCGEDLEFNIMLKEFLSFGGFTPDGFEYELIGGGLGRWF